MMLDPGSYWCHKVYVLNCEIHRAFKAGDQLAVDQRIALLDLLHAGQAWYARRWHTPLGRLGL
jgi:hypothetical protein